MDGAFRERLITLRRRVNKLFDERQSSDHDRVVELLRQVQNALNEHSNEL